MLHALGFAGGAGGVEQKQGMFCLDPNRRAIRALGCGQFVHPEIAGGGEGHVAAGSLIDHDMSDGVAAAERQGLVDDGFERQRFAAASLFVGGDHQHGAGIFDTVAQRLRRKAAEHDRVRGPDSGAGLHGHHALNRHGHVDHHAVALVHPERFECVGKAAHLVEQFGVAHAGDGAVIGLEHDRSLVALAGLHVHIQAVEGHIEPTIVEPFVERGLAVVECVGEGMLPLQVFPRHARPEAGVIGLGLGAEGAIGVHAGNAGGLHGLLGGVINLAFVRVCGGVAHDSLLRFVKSQRKGAGKNIAI